MSLTEQEKYLEKIDADADVDNFGVYLGSFDDLYKSFLKALANGVTTLSEFTFFFLD